MQDCAHLAIHMIGQSDACTEILRGKQNSVCGSRSSENMSKRPRHAHLGSRIVHHGQYRSRRHAKLPPRSAIASATT